MRKSKLSNERRAIDAMYRENFTAFVYAAFKIVNPRKQLIENWHIDCICYLIMQLLSGEAIPRLVVNLPPRSLKSFIVSVCLPAWILGRDPTARIICASYNEELAKKFSRDCRALMESEFYRRVFPGTRLNPKKTTEVEFETTRRGFRMATSVGGTLTGRGGDFLLIDDPIKADEVASETALNNANEWFFNSAISRLDKPGESVIIVTMQRLHANDLSGVLVEKGWPRLAIPALAEEATDYVTGEDQVHHRAEGEALQPSRIKKEHLIAAREQMGSALFAAQFQQNPTPADGNRISKDWIKYYDKMPEQRCSRVIISCDPAAKAGPNNDYTAITVAGLLNKNVHILEVVKGRWLFTEMCNQIVALSQKWRPDTILIEDTSSGMALVQVLKDATYLPVIPRKPKMGKEDRMTSHLGTFETGRIFLPKEAPWLTDFLHELLAFPNGRHDDQVDSLLLLLDWLVETNAYIGWVGPVIIKMARSEFETLHSHVATPW